MDRQSTQAKPRCDHFLAIAFEQAAQRLALPRRQAGGIWIIESSEGRTEVSCEFGVKEPYQPSLVTEKDTLSPGPEHRDEVLALTPRYVLERDEHLIQPTNAVGLVVVR